MSNTLRLSKKLFTYAVVAATILWSVGFAAIAAPLAASAADSTVTLTAGQNIQNMTSKAVFYYGANGKRYTYPTGAVYLSWYPDWKGVTKISDSQMAGIEIGGTVAYRAGTRLVKVPTAAATYAVEPNGNLRQIPDEATAKALYGAKWNKTMTDDVDAAIFPYVYKIGTALGAGEYPNGSVVKDASGQAWLIGAGKTKQKVSADGEKANWVQSKFVVSTNVDLSGYTAGADVTAKVASWTTVVDTAAVATTTTTTTPAVPAGTGLTVALGASQPVASTIVTDSANGAQALIPALNVNFTASADGDVKVKTVSVTRGGVSADTDVVNMYLYDGDKQLASSPSISNKKFTFSNSSGLFTVAKGTTKNITVKFDVLNAGAAGKVINLAVVASGDVATDGAAVNGTFPMTSSNFTTALISDLGKFTLTNISPTAAANINAGSLQYEIWRLQAVTTAQDVEIRSVKFTVVGSVNVGDVQNFSLWDGATQIGSTVANMASDKTVTVDVTAKPYVFLKGSTKTLSLKADIIGGSTRTLRASIQGAGDLVIYDRGYNVFLKHAGSDTFTVLQPITALSVAVDYTVSTGTLSVSVATDSPTGNVASSTTGVTLSKFTFLASGEDVKVTSLHTTCTDSTTTKTIKNVKLLWNGSQVGSTVATSDACDGSTTTLQVFTLGSTMIARVGVPSTLSIVADLTGTTTATETIHADLVVGTTNATTLVSLSSISTSAATGRTLTISANTLTVSLNSSFGNKSSSNPTCAINAQGVKIGSFVLVGGAGEDADVSQIQLSDTSTTYYLSQTQNVKLMHGTTQIAATLASPAAGSSAVQTHTFNVSPVVTVPAGGQYVVDVVADCKSTASATAGALVGVSAVTASGHLTGTSANSSGTVALQNAYISSAGGLGITISSDTPLATNLLMGATDQTIGKFQLTASSTEPINLTQLVISSQFTSAATGTVKNIRLYDDSNNSALIGTVAGFDATQASNSNATGTFAGAKFTGISLLIPAGTTKTITVKADLASYVDLGVSLTGQGFKLAILTDFNGVSAGTQLPVTGTGAQSGVALDTSNTYVVASTGSIPWSQTGTLSAGVHGGITGTVTAGTFAATTAMGATGLGANYSTAYANEFVLYRAKLSIAWDPTFYAASGVSSINAQQQIGKFVVTNAANSGSYAATLGNLNFTITTTLSITAANTAAINVYKDNLSTTALITSTFQAAKLGIASGQSTAADSAFNTGFKETLAGASGGYTQVEIAAGSSKTIYVTLDTSNMTGAAQSTKNLTIGISTGAIGYYLGAAKAIVDPAYGFVWADNGVNSNTTGGTPTAGTAPTIIASDNLLPLSSKTYTYSF